MALTCIHWYKSCIMLLDITSDSICPLRPSAKPLSKSNATIMKSLSGASNCSGFVTFACKYSKDYVINLKYILKCYK